MIINSPASTRVVTDYDFHFIPAGFLGLTVDPKWNDAVFEDENTYTIHLGSRPSATSTDEMTGEETVIVQKAKLAYTAIRKRESTERTPEQQDEWRKTLAELATPKSIN